MMGSFVDDQEIDQMRGIAEKGFTARLVFTLKPLVGGSAGLRKKVVE